MYVLYLFVPVCASVTVSLSFSLSLSLSLSLSADLFSLALTYTHTFLLHVICIYALLFLFSFLLNTHHTLTHSLTSKYIIAYKILIHIKWSSLTRSLYLSLSISHLYTYER